MAALVHLAFNICRHYLVRLFMADTPAPTIDEGTVAPSSEEKVDFDENSLKGEKITEHYLMTQ